ncbi:hypothetical protein N6H05_08590 [Sphingobium sp. WTD-1]|uniref:hypothetical protein n=1 Tax=Sphingobium sp. WTD-1 TaxID=2979467 RepID=UPI0024DE4B56|nr:hypothetical protein [Sphingobium sp. WTD-1]WIA57838.1 hypothetical protein N6H05_08590 [Sphingobium sp. WTD-1]
MPSRFAAKESVGYYATWTLGARLAEPLNISEWIFEATFERWAADPEAFTLEMAASDADQGFRIFNPVARQITCRILPATLAGISDTTGRFTMLADLLATPPGADRFFIADLELTIVRGPTA